MFPETRVVRDLPPAFANASDPAYLAMRQITKDIEQHLVRQLLDRLWSKRSRLSVAVLHPGRFSPGERRHDRTGRAPDASFSGIFDDESTNALCYLLRRVVEASTCDVITVSSLRFRHQIVRHSSRFPRADRLVGPNGYREMEFSNYARRYSEMPLIDVGRKATASNLRT